MSRKVVPTSDFIDSMTSFVKVFLVFYAPRVGITSLLTVNADFMDDQEVTMKVKLGHFSVLEGNSLLLYTVIQSSCIFLILLMFIDTIFKIRHEYANCKPDPSVPGSTWTFPEASMIFSELTDTAIISQYVFQQIPRRYTSADVAQEIVSGITSIDWASDSLSLIGRKTAYFDQIKSIISLQEEEDGLAAYFDQIKSIISLQEEEDGLAAYFDQIKSIISLQEEEDGLAAYVDQIMGIIPLQEEEDSLAIKSIISLQEEEEDGLAVFANMILLVSMLRVVQATNLHPRLGVWRFGVERDDFKDFTTTVLTSVTMLMGELPRN
ncbi:hypothetical protein T484DRAFT_1778765 [Baffinella frigidus]|nr:hypothetical protein T484DRAFT_1778765 [Cryptophyta sp. CCMP2293]